MDFSLRQIVGQPKRCFFYGCGKVAERELKANGCIYPICEECLENIGKCLKHKMPPKTKNVENVENEV